MGQQLNFYNTTHEEGSELHHALKQVNKQNREIYDIFRDKLIPLSPSYVELFMKGKPPITSVRRGITDLTIIGLLVKTKNKTMGKYGRKEHNWRLADGTYL